MGAGKALLQRNASACQGSAASPPSRGGNCRQGCRPPPLCSSRACCSPQAACFAPKCPVVCWLQPCMPWMSLSLLSFDVRSWLWLWVCWCAGVASRAPSQGSFNTTTGVAVVDWVDGYRNSGRMSWTYSANYTMITGVSACLFPLRSIATVICVGIAPFACSRVRSVFMCTWLRHSLLRQRCVPLTPEQCNTAASSSIGLLLSQASLPCPACHRRR